jgi:hypothetical protein
VGLVRLFLGVKDPKPATDEDLLEIATELVPPGRGWQWNQALMEQVPCFAPRASSAARIVRCGDGFTLRELGRRVTQDFDEGDARWLHAAVESLCEDDLAKVSPAPVAPEVPGMVAEERAPYGAGPQEPSREEWVSLH